MTQWLFFSFRWRAPVRCLAPVLGLSLILCLSLAQPVLAGPPFQTDDPVPVETGHWEINNFVTSTMTRGARTGAIPGVDANYGAIENLQLHIQPSLAFAKVGGDPTKYGFGDLEVGAKYRFLSPSDTDWWPQVATYPLLEIPTGDSDRNLGTGHVHAFLPIWIQKDIGKWTTFGGGGYWINPGSGNRNYWFIGWELQYALTDSLALGGEVFHLTPSSVYDPTASGVQQGAKQSTSFNIGGTYDFNKTYHLLFSAGHGIQNASANNVFSYYVALQVTY